MRFFGTAYGLGGAKGSTPYLKSAMHIPQLWTWHSSALSKEDANNYINYERYLLNFANISIFHHKLTEN